MSTPLHEKRKTPVVDASSAILLFKAGLFDRLSAAYEIRMAECVFRELTDRRRPGAGRFIQAEKAGEIAVHHSTPPPADDRKGFFPGDDIKMDDGERDTLRLFASGTGDFIMIDDRKGAAFCRDFGIPYINALLVPKIFQLTGILSHSESVTATETLLTIGRYSSKILEKAESITKSRLAMFLP